MWPAGDEGAARGGGVIAPSSAAICPAGAVVSEVGADVPAERLASHQSSAVEVALPPPLILLPPTFYSSFHHLFLSLPSTIVDYLHSDESPHHPPATDLLNVPFNLLLLLPTALQHLSPVLFFKYFFPISFV